MSTPPSIDNLIDTFSKLPGIGKKSARRVAYYLLNAPREEAMALARAIADIKNKIRYCSRCFNLAESELCGICSDPKRDKSVICIVEQPINILQFEKTNEYNGLYHVLGGVLSPLDGVGPENLHIKELLNRTEDVKEIIIALNPSSEGDTTTHYLQNLLQEKVPKISRLARGIPVGGDLEYSSEDTITRALLGRVNI
ncbi:recombination protein RecR [bacterium]|nr:recombination protein RecR [bacterium]